DVHHVYRIRLVDAQVAVLQRRLGLVDVAALGGVETLVLDEVALLLPVAERPVEVALVLDLAQLVLAERLHVLVALPGLDLPAGLAVEGGDAGEALHRELVAHRRRAASLLDDRRLDAAAAGVAAGAP